MIAPMFKFNLQLFGGGGGKGGGGGGLTARHAITAKLFDTIEKKRWKILGYIKKYLYFCN